MLLGTICAEVSMHHSSFTKLSCYLAKSPSNRKIKAIGFVPLEVLPAANWGGVAAVGATARRWAVGRVEEVRFPAVGSSASVLGNAAAHAGKGRYEIGGYGGPGGGYRRYGGVRRPCGGASGWRPKKQHRGGARE
jgi:hypothetical protein